MRVMVTLWVVSWLPTTSVFAGFTKITEGEIVNDSGWCYGCAWVDYSGDGLPDLFVDNNNPNQGRSNFLYLNNGDGTFTRDTQSVVANDDGSSYGCTWGDHDNDGYPDLFVSNYNEDNFLYHNNGGSTFTKVTSGRIVSDGGRSTGCSWADYDNDGLVDLFVCNRDQVNFLYHNEGGGTFTRVTAGAIATDVDNSSGCAWADYDDDGLFDLVVANVQTPNCLYHNDGSGSFTRVTTGPVVTDTSRCNGASWADMDNDGDLDLFVATGVLGMYNDLLYRNNGDGTFTRVTDSPIVRDATWSGGSAWADWDNDGDVDLFVGGYDGHNRMYENDGTGTFTSVDTGAVVQGGSYIMGSAWADYDRDGDLDLYTARNNYFGGVSCLYRNDGNSNHWFGVRCVGTASNRAGVGARVRIRARLRGQDVSQVREIATQSGGGNSGESEPIASFGLSDAAVVDSLIARWPSGTVDVLTGLAVNQYFALTEGQSAVGETGTAATRSETPAASICRSVLDLTSVLCALRSDFVLLDVAGRKVADLEPSLNDVSGLASGVYFACLEWPDGRVHRVVVQR